MHDVLADVMFTHMETHKHPRLHMWLIFSPVHMHIWLVGRHSVYTVCLWGWMWVCVHLYPHAHISVWVIHSLLTFLLKDPGECRQLKLCACLTCWQLCILFQFFNVCSFSRSFDKKVLNSLKEVFLIAGVRAFSFRYSLLFGFFIFDLITMVIN